MVSKRWFTNFTYQQVGRYPLDFSSNKYIILIQFSATGFDKDPVAY